MGGMLRQFMRGKAFLAILIAFVLALFYGYLHSQNQTTGNSRVDPDSLPHQDNHSGKVNPGLAPSKGKAYPEIPLKGKKKSSIINLDQDQEPVYGPPDTPTPRPTRTPRRTPTPGPSPTPSPTPVPCEKCCIDFKNQFRRAQIKHEGCSRNAARTGADPSACAIQWISEKSNAESTRDQCLKQNNCPKPCPAAL